MHQKVNIVGWAEAGALSSLRVIIGRDFPDIEITDGSTTLPFAEAFGAQERLRKRWT
jgi:hypothetical protein